MSRVNTCGFETGDLSEVAGGASITAGAARTGQYGADCNGVASSSYVTITGMDGIGKPVSLNLPTIYVQAHIKWVSTTTTGYYDILRLSASGGDKLAVALNESGNLEVLDVFNNVLNTFVGAFSLTAWNCLEVMCGTGTNAPWGVRLNGVVLGSDTINNTNNTLSVYVGINDVMTRRLYVDDISIDTASYPGGTSIARVDPSTPAQTFTNWTGTAADVDDYASGAGNDGDTTDLTTVEENYPAEAALGEFSPAYSSIPSVKSVVICRDEAQANEFRIGMYDGGALQRASLTSADNSTGSYEVRCQLRETTPAGNTWTAAQFSYLSIGPEKIQTQSRTLHFTACAAMVEYVPPPPAISIPVQLEQKMNKIKRNTLLRR